MAPWMSLWMSLLFLFFFYRKDVQVDGSRGWIKVWSDQWVISLTPRNTVPPIYKQEKVDPITSYPNFSVSGTSKHPHDHTEKSHPFLCFSRVSRAQSQSGEFFKPKFSKSDGRRFGVEADKDRSLSGNLQLPQDDHFGSYFFMNSRWLQVGWFSWWNVGTKVSMLVTILSKSVYNQFVGLTT